MLSADPWRSFHASWGTCSPEELRKTAANWIMLELQQKGRRGVCQPGSSAGTHIHIPLLLHLFTQPFRKYSHPSVATGDWFQDPHGYQDMRLLTSLTLGGIVQLTLEQHGFELHESTYTQISSIINTAGLYDPGLVESSEVETQIWRNCITGG